MSFEQPKFKDLFENNFQDESPEKFEFHPSGLLSKVFFEGYDYTIKQRKLKSDGSITGYYRCSSYRKTSCPGGISIYQNLAGRQTTKSTKDHHHNCLVNQRKVSQLCI
jgi:hypothetical protein